MRRQSVSARATAAARRRMWQQLGVTACHRCWQARATDLHEKLCRSRGGDPADPDQAWPLCRDCHDFVHLNPELATAEGWLIPSWSARDPVPAEHDGFPGA